MTHHIDRPRPASPAFITLRVNPNRIASSNAVTATASRSVQPCKEA